MANRSPWSDWLSICLLRRAPQDVPHSQALTRNMVIVSVLADSALVYVARSEHAVPAVLISLGFLLLVPWLLLNFTGLSARYWQTLAALAGTSVLFCIGFLPVIYMWQQAGPIVEGETPSQLHLAAFFLHIGLNAWRLIVVAHIFRHALGVRMFAASLLAVSWFVVEFSANSWLFG